MKLCAPYRLLTSNPTPDMATTALFRLAVAAKPRPLPTCIVVPRHPRWRPDPRKIAKFTEVVRFNNPYYIIPPGVNTSHIVQPMREHTYAWSWSHGSPALALRKSGRASATAPGREPPAAASPSDPHRCDFQPHQVGAGLKCRESQVNERGCVCVSLAKVGGNECINIEYKYRSFSGWAALV